MTRVKHSGFELVPRRKQPGKLATMKDFAKVDFKPWTRDKSLRPSEMITAWPTPPRN